MELILFILGVLVGVVITLVLQTVAIMWHEPDAAETEVGL